MKGAFSEFWLACAALTWGACIQADRDRFITSATDTGDEVDDDVVTTEPPEVVSDGDDPPPECDLDHPCEQPSAPCAEATCENGFCIVGRKEHLSPCDDGNPCTRLGACDGDECLMGEAVEDGTSCDDGFVCNGVAECQSGECVTSIVSDCPASDVACVARFECSEELDGQCAPVPAPDGDRCPLNDADEGRCSRGACVPEGMVLVPSGAFLMGCDPGPLCPFDARPMHDVALRAYAIDETEVTEGMWHDCVTRGGCKARDNEAEPNVMQRDSDAPVRDISWDRAAAMCASVGKRLCTEAEWEKAARGTDGTFNFPWGNAVATCDRAIYHELLSGPGCGSAGPDEVGKHDEGASPYGALDMAGNVAEWVRDAYDADIYESRVAGTPENPVFDPSEGGTVRVIRGGGWKTLVDGIRVFKRIAQSLTFVDSEVGVRCCWSEGD